MKTIRFRRDHAFKGHSCYWTDESDQVADQGGEYVRADVAEALLAACEGERRELAADQPSSSRSAWAKDIYRQRLARLDTAIALAYEGPSTGDRSEP
jgi:hypothetical protein